jgi:transposase
MTSTTSANTETDSELRRLRLRQANRHDVVPVPARLEDLIAQDHLARLIWEVVGRLDLSPFYARLKVFEGEPGAPAIDPKILITLWLYAISQGVSSAREIDDLRVTHIAYIWICGGVYLNYHTISDFRTDYEQELDELEEMPAARAAKKPEERDKARVSSTDPEARVMKMPDGGYRPAYNWQFSVELTNFVITGVDVTNIGSDKAQMEPMVEQVVERTDQLLKNWLVDGGFVKFTAIEALAVMGVAVFGPVPEPRGEDRDRYAPSPTDSDVIAEWRQRMGTEEGKATYKQRSLVELPNAHARSRDGIQQVRVRGRRKVRCVALWVAITHNLLVWIRHLRQVISSSKGQLQECGSHVGA